MQFTLTTRLCLSSSHLCIVKFLVVVCGILVLSITALAAAPKSARGLGNWRKEHVWRRRHRQPSNSTCPIVVTLVVVQSAAGITSHHRTENGIGASLKISSGTNDADASFSFPPRSSIPLLCYTKFVPELRSPPAPARAS